MLVRWLAATALALVNVLLFMLIILAASLPSPLGGLAGGLRGLTAAPDRLAHSLSARSAELRQELADRFDPAHPPRHAMSYDVESSAWLRVGMGGIVATSPRSQLTLVDVRPREDATAREQAYYAVLRQQLAAPQVTMLFGVPVRTDTGEVDRVLYQGESFQMGDVAYKVNWVGHDPSEIAVGQYRRHEDVPATLKFTAP